MTDSNKSTQGVVKEYAEELRAALGCLPVNKISAAIDLITSTLEHERAIFTVGNGGSATTAQHMTADICAAWSSLDRTGSVTCLNDNVARWSAIVNDFGPDHSFSRQLKFLGRPGDLLIMFSVSAESSNLLTALRVAQEMGLRTLVLAGRRGQVAVGADISVEVGNSDYGLAEDLHLWFSHCLVRHLRRGAHRYQEHPQGNPMERH